MDSSPDAAQILCISQSLRIPCLHHFIVVVTCYTFDPALFNSLFFFRSLLLFVGRGPYLSEIIVFVGFLFDYRSCLRSIFRSPFLRTASFFFKKPLLASRIATRTVVRPPSSRCPAVIPGSFVPLKCHRTFQSQKRSCFIARFHRRIPYKLGRTFTKIFLLK